VLEPVGGAALVAAFEREGVEGRWLDDRWVGRDPGWSIAVAVDRGGRWAQAAGADPAFGFRVVVWGAPGQVVNTAAVELPGMVRALPSGEPAEAVLSALRQWRAEIPGTPFPLSMENAVELGEPGVGDPSALGYVAERSTAIRPSVALWAMTLWGACALLMGPHGLWGSGVGFFLGALGSRWPRVMAGLALGLSLSAGLALGDGSAWLSTQYAVLPVTAWLGWLTGRHDVETLLPAVLRSPSRYWGALAELQNGAPAGEGVPTPRPAQGASLIPVLVAVCLGVGALGPQAMPWGLVVAFVFLAGLPLAERQPRRGVVVCGLTVLLGALSGPASTSALLMLIVFAVIMRPEVRSWSLGRLIGWQGS